jgi:N-acetylglutamate synthase-like GNAT family acetyltransferase
MSAKLRPARDSDSESVIDLIGGVFAEYPGCVLDVDLEEPELRAPASSFTRFFVAEEAGRIIGCGGLQDRGNGTIELKKLYLKAEVRGRGLARELVELIEDHARSVKAARIELWSDTRFVAAHGFYERMGYRTTGRSRDLNDLSNTTEYHYEKAIGPGKIRVSSD